MSDITKSDMVYVSTSKNCDYVSAVPHDGSVAFRRAPVWHRMDDAANPPPKGESEVDLWVLGADGKGRRVAGAVYIDTYARVTHWCYSPAPPATEPASPKEPTA